MSFQLALYKHTRPGLQGVYSRLVRLVDRGPYSHCELVFSNGLSASSSFIDGSAPKQLPPPSGSPTRGGTAPTGSQIGFRV